MVYCSTLGDSIKKRVEAGKTLEEIGEELCSDGYQYKLNQDNGWIHTLSIHFNS